MLQRSPKQQLKTFTLAPESKIAFHVDSFPKLAPSDLRSAPITMHLG